MAAQSTSQMQDSLNGANAVVEDGFGDTTRMNLSRLRHFAIAELVFSSQRTPKFAVDEECRACYPDSKSGSQYAQPKNARVDLRPSRRRGTPREVRRDSPNKLTVERYLDEFRHTDHEQILECLTDDIRWTVFGAFSLKGKEAYDAAVKGPDFSGNPDIEVVRMAEGGDTVMMELVGHVPQPDGSIQLLVMAEVFRMRDGLIYERRAWVIPLDEDDVR